MGANNKKEKRRYHTRKVVSIVSSEWETMLNVGLIDHSLTDNRQVYIFLKFGSFWQIQIIFLVSSVAFLTFSNYLFHVFPKRYNIFHSFNLIFTHNLMQFRAFLIIAKFCVCHKFTNYYYFHNQHFYVFPQFSIFYSLCSLMITVIHKWHLYTLRSFTIFCLFLSCFDLIRICGIFCYVQAVILDKSICKPLSAIWTLYWVLIMQQILQLIGNFANFIKHFIIWLKVFCA